MEKYTCFQKYTHSLHKIQRSYLIQTLITGVHMTCQGDKVLIVIRVFL